MIGCLGPMVGTVVVAVNPPGPSAQMAIAEAAGPCPEDTAFCRERNPPMPTRGDNGLTFKKSKKILRLRGDCRSDSFIMFAQGARTAMRTVPVGGPFASAAAVCGRHPLI